MEDEKKYPRCMKKHFDCFAYFTDDNGVGKCRILTKTEFLGKDCPFYKTKKQCAEEEKRRIEYLNANGLGHLYHKYGGK